MTGPIWQDPAAMKKPNSSSAKTSITIGIDLGDRKRIVDRVGPGEQLTGIGISAAAVGPIGALDSGGRGFQVSLWSPFAFTVHAVGVGRSRWNSPGGKPHRVIHELLGIGEGHVAVLAGGGVPDEEEAAAGLGGVLLVADEQDAVAIEDFFGAAHADDAVLPGVGRRPAEAAADGGAGLEGGAEGFELGV